MSEDLPARDEKHVIGEEGVRAVKNAVPSEWIVREQTGDYGVDLEIEFATKTVSGRLCKAQVRGHRVVPWATNGTYLQHAKQTTMNYWAAMPVPVVVLVPETSSGRVFWAMSDRGREAGGVRVRRESTLPAGAHAFQRLVTEWLEVRGSTAVLNAVPLFVEAWKAAQNRLDRDCFLSLDDQRYFEAQALCTQTMRLREVLGLPYGSMLTWEMWCARARVTFGPHERFFWGTFDEMVEYLRPFVEEAVGKARKVLKSQPVTAGNATAKSWAESEDNYVVVFGIPDEARLDAEPMEFWAEMDERLRQHGALRYPAARGWRFGKKGEK